MSGTVLAITTLAQEEGGGGGGTSLILPPLGEIIWGAIAFAIVVFVLMKFAFPKLREAVEERERTIQKSLEDSEEAKNEARKVLDDYKEQLAQARSESNRIIEDARQQAERVRQEIIARAEKDAEGIVERAEAQIVAERNRTVQELQGQIATLSIELAEKVVGRSLDGGAQRDLVDAYIREVSGMQPGDGSRRN